MHYTSNMSDHSSETPMQPVILKQKKKAQHNKRYYDLHKQQCFRKSLIYDIKKIGRIPKKEIMQRYNLTLDEFIQLFGTWAVNRSLTQEKKEQLSHLVIDYFDFKPH